MFRAPESAHFEQDQTVNGRLSFSRRLPWLYAGSFVLHLLIVTIFIYQPIALDDMYQYDMLARSIQNGEGFRWYSKADVEVLRPYYASFLDLDRLEFPANGLITTFRAPGYPFFLALLYLLTSASSHFIIARLGQAALAAAMAPAAAILGRHLGLPPKAALLAGVGLSFYPILLFYPIGLVSENLYIPLGIFSILSIVLAARKKAPGWMILAGLTCGLLMLTRSIFMIFVLLAGLWISRYIPLKRKAGLVFLLAAFGLCLPWSIRNSLLMHKPTFVENNLGYNLFIGYHPQGDGGFVSRVAILPMNILDDAEREAYCMQQAREFIRQNPIEAARRVVFRLVKFIGPEDREFFFFYGNNLLGSIAQPWLALIYLLLLLPWAGVLLFGTIGIWLTKAQPLTKIVLLFLISYGLPHLFIIAEPRFHLAWVPVLIPCAAYGWSLRKALLLKPPFARENYPLTLLLVLILSLMISGFIINLPTLLAMMSPGGNQIHLSY